jgi:hypothetical protein
MEMVVTFDIAPLRHYENMSLRPDDLNVRVIKPRQYGSGNDFVDGTERCAAPAEIKHAINDSEELVELVCAKKQNRDPPCAAESKQSQSQLPAGAGRD